MTTQTLIIGNMATSSWSLRPWLLMREKAIPFETIKLRLDVSGAKAALLQHSPSGLVPALKRGEEVLGDSLAISETLAEEYPDRGLWPRDPAARRMARSMVAEMHAGFTNLRTVWPMDALTIGAGVLVPTLVRRDLDRIFHLWETARSAFGASGPFLFGAFSIADAFYAPVILRLRAFGPVAMSPTCQAYYDAMFALDGMQAWLEGAREEAKLGWYGEGRA